MKYLKHLLTTFVLLACGFSMTAETIGDLKYTLDATDMTATVTGLANSEITNLIIPSKVSYEGKEYTVTAIGRNACKYTHSIQYVEIPNTVLIIGQHAFEDCGSLSSVKIGDSVTTIDAYAFYGSALTSIEIPDCVETIGECAFEECIMMKSIVMGNSVESIGGNAFFNCTALTDIKLSDSLISIGSYAFAYCTSMSGIIIPASVRSIGSDAFDGSRLKKMTCYGTTPPEIKEWDGFSNVALYVPDESLDAYKSKFGSMFLSINGIDSSRNFTKDGIAYTIISDTEKTVMTKAGTEAEPGNFFSGALSLPETVDYLGETYTLTEIGTFGFSNNSELTSIAFPSTITRVGEAAFWECTALQKVEATSLKQWCLIDFETGNDHGFSSNPLQNAHRLFIDGKEITEITIPLYLSEIKTATFVGMKNLKSVSMPNDVRVIGDRAFLDCSSLTDVDLSENITEIGIGAFYRTGIENIDLKRARWLKTIKFGAFSCTPLVSIVIPNSVETLEHMVFQGCTNLKSVVIGDNVKAIPEQMFYECEALENVHLGKSVEEIGGYAFVACKSLREIEIPNSVKLISSSVFSVCDALETLKLPASLQNIGRSAIYNCSALKNVYSYATTPGTCESDDSFEPSADCVLHVPRNTKNLYKAATGWKNFTIVEDDLPNANYDMASNVYILPGEEKSLAEEVGDLAVASWESSNQNVATVDADGNVTAVGFGKCYIIAKDNEGADLAVFELFVCPTIAVEHGSGTIYQHHVLYNSMPSLYIAAPEGYEIAGVTHDDMDVTDAVVNNNGNYVATAPIAGNSVINIALKTAGPSIPTEVDPTEIPDANVKVLVYGRQVVIDGAEETAYVTITDESGKVYYNDTDKSITLANGGIYIIKIEGCTSAYKIIVR